jgi:hypothetical protein
MPDAKFVFRNDGVTDQAVDAKPLVANDEITARHLNGREQTIVFEALGGDKLDQVRVRWPLAGFYDVDINTGALLGGGKKKGRKAASVWSVVPGDMRRIRATQQKQLAERRERMRKNKASYR